VARRERAERNDGERREQRADKRAPLRTGRVIAVHDVLLVQGLRRQGVVAETRYAVRTRADAAIPEKRKLLRG
jgi:hypothetical protein